MKGVAATTTTTEKNARVVSRQNAQHLYVYSYADFLPKSDMDMCQLTRGGPWQFCDPFISFTVVFLFIFSMVFERFMDIPKVPKYSRQQCVQKDKEKLRGKHSR